MCFTNCSVQINVLNVYVQVLRKLTSVVVFVEKLEYFQQLHSQRTLQVYQHLNALKSERSEVKDSNVLRYNLNKRQTCLRYTLKTLLCKT